MRMGFEKARNLYPPDLDPRVAGNALLATQVATVQMPACLAQLTGASG